MATDGASGADRSDSSNGADQGSKAESVSRETADKARDAISGRGTTTSSDATAADRAASQSKMEAQGSVAKAGTTVSDTVTETTQTVATAATGYRADMYGEIGVGNRTANIAGQRQFGGAVRGSTLADASFTARQGTPGAPGFGIDDFARADRRGSFARSSAVSATATYNDAVARSSAPGGPAPADITFEQTRSSSAGTRVDDMAIGSNHSVETKAATSVKSGQVAIDVADAAAGRTIEYSITNNPNTGATGLNPSAQTRMNTAVANSNGNLSVSYNPDLAPSRASVEALETAAKVSRVGRAMGKVAVPVGIAADTYAIGSAYRADGNTFGTNTKVAVAESAGGWAGAGAGAWGGAKAGAAIGTAVGGPIGTAVGAVAGGVIGAVGGALVGSGVIGGWAKSWFG